MLPLETVGHCFQCPVVCDSVHTGCGGSQKQEWERMCRRLQQKLPVCVSSSP